VAGVTRFCLYPPEAVSKPRVAGFSDINFEAVLRLRPDLALLPADKAADKKQLERLGIPVLTLDTRSLTEFFRSIESIGSATGRFSEADSIIKGFQQALQAARDRTGDKTRPRVLFSVMRSRRELGRITEIHAVGRDGFFQELIEAAGGKNAYQGNLAFPRLSRESILFLDPDVIIDALSAGEDAQKARREWESLESLRAVRNHRLYLLTDSADTVPGPRSARTLAKLSAAFHPEDSGARGSGMPGKNAPAPRVGEISDQAGAFSEGDAPAPYAEEAP
jgi:iron complex transport system substrate-binding protein